MQTKRVDFLCSEASIYAIQFVVLNFVKVMETTTLTIVVSHQIYIKQRCSLKVHTAAFAILKSQ